MAQTWWVLAKVLLPHNLVQGGIGKLREALILVHHLFCLLGMLRMIDRILGLSFSYLTQSLIQLVHLAKQSIGGNINALICRRSHLELVALVIWLYLQ